MIASTWSFAQNEQLLKVFNDQVRAFNLGDVIARLIM